MGAAQSGGFGGGGSDEGGGKVSPEKKKKKKTKKKGVNDNGQRKDKRFVKNAAGVELCFRWNRSVDGCSANCDAGRARQCEWCLGPHRATDPSCRKRPAGWSPKPSP